jgi:hypothetical protein
MNGIKKTWNLIFLTWCTINYRRRHQKIASSATMDMKQEAASKEKTEVNKETAV